MPENKELLKYQGPEIKSEDVKKPVEMIDRSPELVLPRNVENWMTKLEKGQTQTQTVTDAAGQPLIQPATPVSPKVVLPITRSSFVAGFKKKVGDAGKWLSTFIFRLIKIKKGKVVFKEE